MDQKQKKRRGRPPKLQHLSQPNMPPAKKTKHRHQSSQADRFRKLQEAKEDTRKQFNKIKARVLSMTPLHLKDMFGQVCFARFGKAWWLVLVLVPYNVPPGSVRNQWTEQFERCRKNDSLDDLNHVVYWYGAREEGSFYGFVAHKDLVTYDEGIQRGYFKPYESVKQKATENKKLTKGEQDKLLAINEVDEDLLKTPEDRKRGVTDFPEVWELLSFDDIDDVDSSSSEEEFMGDLANGDDGEDDEEDDDEAEDEAPEQQRYARKKSYHDSSKLDRGKFVSRRPLTSPKATKSLDDGKKQAITGETFPVSTGPTPLSVVSNRSLESAQMDERLRLSSRSDGYVFATHQTALQQLRLEARNLFNREKEMVLSKLSPSHVNNFGAMGFYKDHAVLIVSPYSVPPGNLRAMWLNKLEEMEKNNQLEKVPYLVYRYDARKLTDNPHELDHCYALVSPDELMSYEEGERKGLGQIPPEIQRRFLLEGEESLSAEDKQLMNVLREKEVDAAKDSSQRTRGYSGFRETYDLLALSASSKG